MSQITSNQPIVESQIYKDIFSNNMKQNEPNQEQLQNKQLLQDENEKNLEALESNDEDKKSQEGECKLLFKKQRLTSIIIDDEEDQNEQTTHKNNQHNQNISSQQQQDLEKQEVLLPPPSLRTSVSSKQQEDTNNSKKNNNELVDNNVEEKKNSIVEKSMVIENVQQPDPGLKQKPKEIFSYQKKKDPIIIDSEEELPPPPSNVSILKQKIEETPPSNFFRKKTQTNQTPIEIVDSEQQPQFTQQPQQQAYQQPLNIHPPVQRQLNSQQKKNQALLEEIVQDDDGVVQDIDYQDWTILNQPNKMFPPKFDRQFRMLDYNDNPQDMIKLLIGEQRFKELLRTCQTTESEFWLYLGAKLIMGFMRLPDISEYFNRDDQFAGGGLRSVITQQQFEEIDQRAEIIQQQQTGESQLAVKLEYNAQTYFRQEFQPKILQELNDRFKKLMQPGQELFLISSCYTIIYTNKIQWFQLIDKQTGVILQQFFWATPVNKTQDINNHRDLQKRLRMMFEPYHLGRYIVYSQDLLNAESVLLLYQQKIFVCTNLLGHSLLPQPPQDQQQQFYQTKGKEPIYLANLNGKWNTCVSLQSLTQRTQYITDMTQQQFAEEKLGIQPSEREAYSSNSSSKIIFVFLIESILHNIRILKKEPIKQFRVDLALKLIEKPIDYKNPIKLIKKKGLITVDQNCQTEQTVGVISDSLYHCPIHNGNARCLVCLKKDQLCKTTASCLGCNKILGRNIYLCIYPCFRLFHLRPETYLDSKDYYQVVGGYDHHDQDQEDEEIDQELLEANLRLKPDTSELDQMYAKTYHDYKYVVPINYEDNYHRKTQIIIIQRDKTQGRRGGGGRGRGSRQQQQQQQQSQAQQQGEIGNQGETEDVPKKQKKLNKKQVPQPQQPAQPEKETEQAGSAMFDFFSQVKKQAYKKLQQQ